MAEWDESKHPRVPSGDVNGGQFTDKQVSAAAGAAREQRNEILCLFMMLRIDWLPQRFGG